ncbi:CoxG family protein [Streptomyces sp.]|uniref:CoxG family protein n=1 Tax=Streptomyces sp. TaxID=1931 RepID=UPI002F3F2C69
MEHESFLPVPAPRVAAALSTPSVVAASLPGWQPDAETAGEPRGRLRLRVGGSTITYRGTVVVAGDGPAFTVTAEGTEVRGTGAVKVTAEVELAPAVVPEPGTTLTWRGMADVDGRLASYEDAVVEAAVRRLLDRFSAQLAENAPEVPEPPAAPAPPGAEAGPVAEAAPEDEPVTGEEPDVVDDLGDPAGADLEDFELVEVEVEVPESAAALDDLVPPAEAAHARRTMIGRSAEEVDHAPPRGRYAPVPPPDSGTAAAAVRWAAPAAAALVASAVVVGRVLRRRR